MEVLRQIATDHLCAVLYYSTHMLHTLRRNQSIEGVYSLVSKRAIVLYFARSQLAGVKWANARAKRMFNDANRLSIVMTMDQFFEESREGRVTGTIGTPLPVWYDWSDVELSS